jgi:LysM repeat protein
MWRWNLHATMAALSVTALVLGSAWSESSSVSPAAAARADGSDTLARDGGIAEPAAAEVSPAAPDTDARSLLERVRTYRVVSGDTLNRIAARSEITVETLKWANSLGDPNRLVPGQELTILPVNGVLHTVATGETVADVAARYGAPAARLVEANHLAEPYALDGGQRLLVPDGRPLPAAAAASGGAWPAPGTGNRSKQQFIEASAAAAQESQRRTRVPVSVAIAQAIHESDWGTSGLARNANNFFGIKARNGEGSAGVYWMDAWEVVNGQDVIVPEPFRAYNNPAESFVDHGLFFVRNSRYRPAFAYADEPREFARAIADAGYATDPGYAAKLIHFMDLYNLYQYDKQPTSASPSAAANGRAG